MDFFRRLINSYPEFDDLINALNEIQIGEYNIIDGMDKAFSSDFEVFYNNQPPSVSKVLKPIGESMKQQVSILQKNFTQLSVLPNDLQFLREQHKEFDKVKQKHLSINEQYNKSKVQTEKAKENFEKIPEGSPDKVKYEAIYNQLQEKEAAIEKEFNASLENYTQKLKEYENSFVENLSSTLGAVAASRQKVAEEQKQIAHDINEMIKTMTYFEDKQIGKLKQILKDLDFEYVD